jgi:50S ribosomal subunit-associated GTPase HflX
MIPFMAVLRSTWHDIDLTLPLSAGDLVAEIHARGEVTEEDYQANGVHLIGRAPADLAARMQRRAR